MLTADSWILQTPEERLRRSSGGDDYDPAVPVSHLPAVPLLEEFDPEAQVVAQIKAFCTIIPELQAQIMSLSDQCNMLRMRVADLEKPWYTRLVQTNWIDRFVKWYNDPWRDGDHC